MPCKRRAFGLDPALTFKSVVLVCIFTAFFPTGHASIVTTSPANAPNSQNISYYLFVQLGGEDAVAVPTVLQLAERALLDELSSSWGTCKVYNAWNVSICKDGSPVPAPYLTVADEGLLPLINAPAPSPVSVVTLLPNAEAKEGKRHLLESSQAGEVASPSVSKCLPQMDVVYKLTTLTLPTEAQLNQTALTFMNGAYLAKMRASGLRLEQALLLNLTAASNEVQPDDIGAGPGSSEMYLFSSAPVANLTNATLVQFGVSLVGPDATVTNDAVLGALYTMVTDSSLNGGSQWLTGANTAIVDVRQEPMMNLPPAASGRRRRLTQSSSGVPTAGADSGSQFAMAVSIRVQNVPDPEVSVVKDTIDLLVSGNRLVDGFKARSIDIEAVFLINFNYTSPAAAPPPLIIPPRSSRHEVVILVLAIVIPVTVVGAIFIGCSIVWWGRLSRRRLGAYQAASSLGSGGKGRLHDSDFSSETLAMLPLEPRASSTAGSLARPSAQIQLLDMPWNDWRIEPSELTILTKPDGNKWLLGTGASGTVYKALRNGVQIVAVKMFKEEVTRGAINSLNSWSHAAQFRREISILKSCHDRNIVQFVGACLAEGQTSLVTEFLENGDLYRAINSPQGSRYHWYRLKSPDGRLLPNSGMARRVALDVARGLHFLHTRKIVHFDLKSANILLARDFTAKIADVGLAKILHDDVLSARREVGTFSWAAPEVLLGQRTTEAADIYSFGVLLHELSAQESPRDRQLRRLRVPEEVPQEINDLIIRCLSIRAEERPTARDLVALLSCAVIPSTFAEANSD